MLQIVPRPDAELIEAYRHDCINKNLSLVRYFSIIALIVFGLHLLHHFRLGIEILSASMIPYTLVYSFNVLYSIVNLLVLPKMRNVPALQSLTVLLTMAYMFFMALVLTLLGVIEVLRGGGAVPFVVGMLVLSIMLQGHYLALLLLLVCCWSLFTIGLLYNMPIEQATSSIMVGFTVIIISAAIARLIEKSRIDLFSARKALDKMKS